MIEMLVVFVVFAAAVMISIRSVGDTLRRDRVSKIASIVSADLEQAFAIAARLRTPVSLRIDPTNRTFMVTNRANTLRYRTRTFTSSGDFPLDFIEANNTAIDIMPSGLSTDTLHLTLGIYTQGGAKYTKAVRVSKAGFVRVDNQ
jgi:Tfp pilus assembly protein FimT